MEEFTKRIAVHFNSSSYFLLYIFRYKWNKLITKMGCEREPVACNHKLCYITQSADGSQSVTTIFKGKEAISNCI